MQERTRRIRLAKKRHLHELKKKRSHREKQMQLREKQRKERWGIGGIG